MTRRGRRRSGVLLHLSSLPGAGAGGVLGAAAARFIDLIADAGFAVWQMLPVGPTDADGSPYFSRSTHAGNIDFIDLAELAEWGWLPPAQAPHAGEPQAHFRLRCLLEALIGFENRATAAQRAEYETFVAAQRHWLTEDGLFVALRAEHQGAPWWEWAVPLRDRDAGALAAARERHAAAIEQFAFEQFLFDRQWRTLRKKAHARGIELFGDVPIYVAHDSVEVWAHRENFLLDADGQPSAVSGVPPDYFSADGQFWGNPLYNWPRMEQDGFSWWKARFATQFGRFDLVRIDHFRGLESYWEIPRGATTGRVGEWRPAAGRALLKALRTSLHGLPLVAENLGVITPEVEKLRHEFHLPGMLILQFAFDGSPTNPYLPHNHVTDAVVYTGTHDNDTTLGWYRGLDEQARQHVHEYFGSGGTDMPLALMRAALASVATLCVLPMQDLLGLDSAARMNRPGTTSGNWGWQLHWEQIPPDLAARFRKLNSLYGRV